MDRLLRVIESHATAEQGAIAEYRRLANSINDLVLGTLMRLLLERTGYRGRSAPRSKLGAIAAKDGAARPKLSELRGTLIIGSERFELRGRAVLIHGRLATRTEWVTETPIGSVVADFAYAQVHLKLVESLQTIEVEDDVWQGESEAEDDSR